MPQNVKLAEVFLNARNFLTITHALLNPNHANVRVVLFAWFVMFERVMDGPSLFYSLDRLVRAFREIMDMILNFFGIIYAWVNLPNPGEQAGGGVFAVVGAGVVGGALIGVGGVAGVAVAAVGVVAAVPIFGFGRAYAWFRPQHETDRQNQRAREYQAEPRTRGPLFRVLGNDMGDLVLNVANASPQL